MPSFLLYTLPGWVALLLLWYTFAPILKRVSGLSMGPLTTLLTPLPWMPIYYVSYYLGEKSWSWTMVAAILLSAVLGLVTRGIYSVENAVLQDRRNEEANELAKHVLAVPAASSSLPPYFLYLRPFAVDGAIPSQYGREDGMYNLEHLDLVDVLRAALEPFGRLIAVGGNSGADRVDSSPGSQSWLDKVEKLAQHAIYIIMAPLIADPSSRSGTLAEIELVKKRFLEKCVWLMPETLIGRSCYVGWKPGNPVVMGSMAHFDHRSAWERVREKLGAVGEGKLALPDYDPDGMLFTLSSEGRVARSVPLSLSCVLLKVRKTRRQLAAIVRLRELENRDASSWWTRVIRGTSKLRMFLVPIAVVLLCAAMYLAVVHGSVVGTYLFGVLGGALWWVCREGTRSLRPSGGNQNLSAQRAFGSGPMQGWASRIGVVAEGATRRLRGDAEARDILFHVLWVAGWGIGMWFGVDEWLNGDHGFFMKFLLGLWALSFGVGGLLVLLQLVGALLNYEKKGKSSSDDV
jgi:hypothetical protein